MLDVLASAPGARDPDLALLAPGRTPLSHAALHAQVDAVGDALAALGLGRGRRVGVALPDGPEAAVAVLAAMSWATCAPLNPRLDPNDCDATLAQLRLDALIVAEGDASPLVAAAAALAVPVVRLVARARAAAGVFDRLAGTALRGPPRAQGRRAVAFNVSPRRCKNLCRLSVADLPR